MFKNYLKIAFRNVLRSKSHAFINVFGLAIGIACSLLVMAFIRNEMTYDAFHENADSLYRIYIHQQSPRGESTSAWTPAPLARALKDEIATTVNRTRIQPSYFSDRWLSHGEKAFKAQVSMADPSLFEMFSFELAHGDAGQALFDLKSVVLSRELAEKLYGQDNPLGKPLTIVELGDFTVTGVLKEIPANSSYKFDALINFDNMEHWALGAWHAFMVQTFVQLPPEQRPEACEALLQPLVEKHFPPRMLKRNSYTLHLQPLRNIYFNREGIDRVEGGSMAQVYILSAIALLIALIACINFMNISIAGSAGRAKEVGLRKTVGAQRAQLVKQFFGESLLLCLIALVLGVALAELFLPAFSALIGKELAAGFFKHNTFFAELLAVLLFFGLLAGSYPALVLSRFQPVEVIKGGLLIGRGRQRFRKFLVLLQFALAILLICSTIVMQVQNKYLTTKELGLNVDQVVAIPLPASAAKPQAPLDVVKAQLLQNPNILAVAAASDYPGAEFFGRGEVFVTRNGEREKMIAVHQEIDADFVKTLKIELRAGRQFSGGAPDSLPNVIVNETFVRQAGLAEPLGVVIETRFRKFPRVRIIGVAQDFHYKSVQHAIEPALFFMRPLRSYGYLLVRLRPDNLRQGLQFLERQWQALVPGHPFDFHFLDKVFARQYQAEKRWSQMVSYASTLAIFVACLGLFGLTGIVLVNRTKEIGIRKVLGATVANVVTLLSKDFVKLVLLANLIAWPAAWFAMNKWLENFAYRVEISWWIFAFAGGIALVIALLTVGTQAIRAALANPVDSLRYE
jgi:ABC-type antimicrobial peptide transport system permease subunit